MAQKKIVSEENLKHFKEQCDAHYGTFTYEQQRALRTWTIVHNMNRKPTVLVLGYSGDELIGDVTYIDNNTISISFSGESCGYAYLT